MAGERRVAVARAQLWLALAGAQREAHMPRALLLPAGAQRPLGARVKALAVQAPAAPLVLLPPVAEPK